VGILARKAIIVAALQVAAGTPAVLAGTNAILAKNMDLKPLEVTSVERDFVKSYFGSSGAVPTKFSRMLSFTVELQSSGTAGLAPAWGPLVQACDMNQAVTAAVKAEYTPLSGAGKYLTLAMNIDGVNFQLNDAMGKVTFALDAGGFPEARFEFIGLAPAGIDAAALAPNYSAFVQPSAVNKVNTPTFTLGTFAGCMSKFNIDFANQIKHRDVVNCETVYNANRITPCSITIELAPFASFNWDAAIRNATKLPVSLVHGAVAGKIIEIAAPAFQIKTASLGDEDDLKVITLGGDLCTVVGNDEMKLIAR
jgi:hypothetical protein